MQNVDPKLRSYAIVKLGGSIITQENGEIDLENLKKLCYEIAQYEHPLIIVHGGGYFIKNILLDNRVETDFFSEEEDSFVKYLRDRLIKLNTSLVNSFQNVGLQSFSIPAHSKFSYRDGKVVPNEGLFDLLDNILKSGRIPIFFGDVLDNLAGGFYFSSSDKIVTCLAKRLKPKLVLFLSNIDGVYETFPPISEWESILPVVSPRILEKLQNKYDVGRGEIYEKLVEAIDCAAQAEVCRIINGRTPGNLLGTLCEQLEVGTRIISEMTQ
ncbi:MAG: isopentenyl phosphate kinase [Chloroflexi bacterium]|nr:isopentenyl phosphate kinase [Chloroflexota bacterium]